MACEKCGGSGWILIERDGISGAEACGCVAAEAAPRDLEAAAGIPPLYRNASFDNFDAQPDNPVVFNQLSNLLVKVKGYVREFPFGGKPGLLLIGPTGTGTTHLAVAALRTILGRGFDGLFFDYSDLLERIRAGWNSDAGESQRQAYERCLETGVLLLDDMGSQRAADWVEDTMTSIVTHRCNHQKPLLVTTNLPDPDAGDSVVQRTPGARVEYRTTLGEKIGERARSRLFEMCEVVRVPAIGDYRVRKKADRVAF